MLVQATGSRDGFTYLNSELDYRDPRCLTIAIPKAVALKLQAQLGEDPLQALKGKHVVVNGTAKRVTVLFLKDGKPTGKYYYQTHVTVTNPKQITVVPKR